MRIRTFCITLFSLLSIALRAQDINFSQFYELPLLRNPALAGIFKGDVMASAAYRTQWGSVSVPYVTQAVGAQVRIPVSDIDYICAGMQFTNDKAGDSQLGKTQALPVLAFNKCLSRQNNTYLSFGVIGGAVQQRFDPSQLKFDDQFVNGSYSALNPTQQTFQSTSLMYWDLATGLSYSSERDHVSYYAGAALFHFNRPRIAFDKLSDLRLNRKYVFNAGVLIPSGAQDALIFYGDYFLQGGNHQGQGGFLYRHDLHELEADEPNISISVGSFYRLNDAVIPVIKFDYYKLSLGVTYDVNFSKLKPASQLRGAYEITIAYHDFIARYNNDRRKTRCPAKF